MILYADVVFIENLCINYIILLITFKILKKKLKKIRILFASIIGGIYAVLSYINIETGMLSLFIKIIMSILIIKIAFNSKIIKEIIQEIIVFYLVTFGLGGAIFAVLFNIGKNQIVIRNGVVIGISSAKILISGIIIGYLIIVKTIKILKKMFRASSVYGNIRIVMNNKEIELKAMLDTGNLLVEPISKSPVIIVEKEKLNNIIPDDILNIDIGGDVERIDVRDEYISKIKLIPYSSVGKENGILMGIRAEKLIIELDNKKYETDDVIIGVFEKQFKSNGKYSALLGIDILERSKRVNEYIANIKGKYKYNLCKIHK